MTGTNTAARGTTPAFSATPYGKGLTLTAATTSWITYSLTPNWVNTNAFSLENIFWATSTGWTSASTDWMQVVNNTAAASVNQWLFYFAATGATTVAGGVSTAGTQTGAYTVSTTPQYLHMVLTWNGATLAFYMNGVSIATAAVASLTGTGSAVCFGGAGGDKSAAGTHLLGNIATVAWTAQEVLDRYTDPYGFLSFRGDFASSLVHPLTSKTVTYDAKVASELLVHVQDESQPAGELLLKITDESQPAGELLAKPTLDGRTAGELIYSPLYDYRPAGELKTNVTWDSASIAGEIYPNVYLRSQSAITYGSRTNATLTAPSGIVNGDLLLIQFLTEGTGAVTATPPAGFNVVPGPSFPVQTTFGTTIAYVPGQSCNAAPGPTASPVTATSGTAVSTGNTVIVFAIGGNAPEGSNLWTCSDNVSGNTYTNVIDGYDGSYNSGALFVGLNIQNSPTQFTVNFGSGTTQYPAIICDTFSGVAAVDVSGAFNTQINPSTSTNAIVSGTFTPTFSGELLYGVTTNNTGSNTQVAGTGWTFAQGNIEGAVTSEYILSGGTGAQSATFTDATNAGANTYLTAALALTPAAAGTVGNWSWYKIAASESGNYTVTHAAANSQGWIGAFGGVDKNTPFGQNETSATGTGGTTTATGITTLRNGCAIVFAGQDIGTTQNVLSGPTGFHTDLTTTIGTSWMYISHYYQNAAGATGSQSITNNGGPWAGFLMAIQPPGSGITVTYDAKVAGELRIAFTNDSLVASELLTKLVRDLVPAGELLTTPLRDSQPAGELSIKISDDSQPAGELSIKFVDDSQPSGELSIHVVNDSQSTGELTRAFVDDSQPAGELMSKIVRDSQPAGELLSSALTVTANGLVNAELISSVSRDMGVACELLTKFTADLVPAAELIRAFVRDLTATAELQAGISTDFRVSAEIIASVVFDGKPAGELLTQALTVTANGLVAGELLIKIVDDSQPAGELLTTPVVVTRDGLAGAELLASIVRDSTPAGELLTAALTVTMNGLAAGELLATAVADARTAGELKSSFTSDYATAGELLVRYASDNAPAAELLSKLVLDSKVAAELLAGIVDDSQPAGELSTKVVRDGQVAGELIALIFTLTTDSFGAAELLASFTVDGYLSAELISAIILLGKCLGTDVAIWTCMYSDQAVTNTPASDQAVVIATESDI